MCGVNSPCQNGGACNAGQDENGNVIATCDCSALANWQGDTCEDPIGKNL